MVALPPMPKSIEKLPRDERGYPIPWFVAFVEGKPEFRIADGSKRIDAVENQLCWICGGKIVGSQVMVVGPVSMVTRCSVEPGCHGECANFAVMACPFLANPAATRRTANKPESVQAGESIDENPGVTCLYRCHAPKPFDDGDGRMLLRLPNPSSVQWFKEGRKAKRNEVSDAFEISLYRFVERVKEKTSTLEMASLLAHIEKARKFIPKH